MPKQSFQSFFGTQDALSQHHWGSIFSLWAVLHHFWLVTMCLHSETCSFSSFLLLQACFFCRSCREVGFCRCGVSCCSGARAPACARTFCCSSASSATHHEVTECEQRDARSQGRRRACSAQIAKQHFKPGYKPALSFHNRTLVQRVVS